MNRGLLLPMVIFFGNVLHCHGITILDFNGPPEQRPGTQFSIPSYTEDGFIFKPLGPILTTPPYDLTRNGGGISFYPENGSAYLQLLRKDSLEFYRLDGSPFSLLAVDLAEYSTLFSVPKSISFRGYGHDGSVITHSFLTDGVIDGVGPLVDFETFIFPDAFSSVVRIELRSNLFSLDNLSVDTATRESVPDEGATWVLLALAIGGMLGLHKATGLVHLH